MDNFNKIILVCPRAKAHEVVKVFSESTRHPELNAFKTLSDKSPRDQVRLDEEETLAQDAAQDAKQTVRQRGDLSTDEFYILSAESTGDEDADETRLIKACDILETRFRKGASGFFGTPETHLVSGDIVNKYYYVAPVAAAVDDDEDVPDEEDEEDEEVEEVDDDVDDPKVDGPAADAKEDA